MKKVKRIDAIVKCIGNSISDMLQRKAKRILRDLDDAIANNSDEADKAELEAEAYVNKLGDAATMDDRSKRAVIFNKYCACLEEAERRKKYNKYLEDLKKKLDEDVEVEEAEKQINTE